MGKDTKDGLGTHFSVPGPSRSPCPSVQLTLLASAPAGGRVHAAHRCARGGMRRCISIALWLPGGFFAPPLLACLLLLVTKFGCTRWRRNFCFWTTEFFICSGKISCEKEEANTWSSCLPCSHSADAVGWEAARHFPPTLWLGHTAFQEGSSPACLPAGLH